MSILVCGGAGYIGSHTVKELLGKYNVVVLDILITGCGKGDNPGNTEISSNVDFNEDDYKKIVFGNNQLGMELLSELEADENGNSFISPTSLFMALSMVYNGAEDVTKEEIAKVLQSEGIDVTELKSKRIINFHAT